ncbi:type 1 glutamine amidotransferase domain-containing protein [Achromobacter marplatensis]|uniref:Type 1 glutamine amidotransferase n=1 Tax=Achromobacter marplatensis TaxID=470868 RepID=A0AA43B2R3_9BURK|nr:type 1 glutamine amidotransferase domain-containing protein [Achromobacter marplatensis]EJO32469.1 protease PfpI [Achromobacter marplatensis]MDH2051994.1 type 1 glutamine amidotransferase [Achromobacter marplatensis]
MATLKDLNVAILATDGFEQVELTGPRHSLQAEGARTVLISARTDPILGMHHDKPGDRFPVDLTFLQAATEPGVFDALLLPGGVVNADEIRMQPKAQEFVRAMFDAGKPVAVICHGAWLLISAGVVKGRKMTSWPSLQDDLRNAGAEWVDEEVVVDGRLVSSRKPDDIPAFNRAFIEVLQAARR